MVNGKVDTAGRALIVLQIRPDINSKPRDVTAWVDTAFTGDLVIPRAMIRELGLQQSAAIAAGLADGTQVVLDTFGCIVEWFGQSRAVEVVENNGKFALLGISLLQDRRLEVDYRSKTLLID